METITVSLHEAKYKKLVRYTIAKFLSRPFDWDLKETRSQHMG